MQVWDVSPASPTYGEKLLTLIGHTDQILHLAWSADGARLLTASQDGTAKIWDATTGMELFTLFGHTAPVGKVAWSPTDDRVLTASYDGTAKVWDPDSALLTVSGLENMEGCVQWAPNADRVTVGFRDGTVKIFDTNTGEELFTIVYSNRTVALCAPWSPDGNHLLMMSFYGTLEASEARLKVYDATSGKELVALVGHSGDVYGSTWSPDGKYIATGGGGDSTARIWDASTGEELFTFTDHNSGVTAALWSPDGKTIASSSFDGSVKIWEPTTGRVIRDLYPADHKISVFALSWSPDGKRIATYAQDGIGSIWDVATGKELATFIGHTSDVWLMRWSNTGKRLFTSSADRTVRVWDTTTGAELLRYNVEGFVDVALSPDNKHIAMSIRPAGLLKIYPAWTTLQELVDYAKDCCVVRELTNAEREQLGLPQR